MILDHLVSVQRLQKDVDNPNKEQYVNNLALSEIKCQIQPASAEEVALTDGVYAQSYILFTTTSGILPGDKLTNLQTEEIYRVKGIEDWYDINLIPHYEMTIVKFEEEEII